MQGDFRGYEIGILTRKGLMILTRKNYKKKMSMLLSIVDRKKVVICLIYDLFNALPIKALQMFEKGDSLIGKMIAYFL